MAGRRVIGTRWAVTAAVATAALLLGGGSAAVWQLRAGAADEARADSSASAASAQREAAAAKAVTLERLRQLVSRGVDERAALVAEQQAVWATAVIAQATQVATDAIAAAQARAAAPAAAPTPAATASIDPCATTYGGPPFYSSPPTVGGDGSNGKIPPDQLAALSWDVDDRGGSYYLRTDAAAALERLNAAYLAEFGTTLGVDMAYRDYDTQVAMREALGTIAAKPGTSRHGLGIAIDLMELPCQYGWDSPARAWMLQHGPDYGWVSPTWSRQDGENPEYWHYEYVG